MLTTGRFSIVGATVLVFLVTVSLAPIGAAASNYRTLHKFASSADGELPACDLILDGAGNLFGVTANGGKASIYGGTVFKLARNQNGVWEKLTIYNFCSVANCVDGQNPYARLTFDQGGNLYGTTAFGGNSGAGTVFKLKHNPNGSWTESVLHSFCSATNCSDGKHPYASVIFDQAGQLYGMTTEGGIKSTAGTIFKLTPSVDGSWTETVLHNFCSVASCSDGYDPQPGLAFDENNNLYGTTYGGGDVNCNANIGCGVVFKLSCTPDGLCKEKVLHRFTGGNDGGFPHAVLVLDSMGNLYGTAETVSNSSQCAGQGCGLVFQLSERPDGTWVEKVLHRFTGGSDGGQPFAGLIFDDSGRLYGTTTLGGNLSHCAGRGCGVVFTLRRNSRGGWNETVLHNFIDNPGAIPFAGVIRDLSGNLYGTTFGDQVSTVGSVFEISPSKSIPASSPSALSIQ